MPNEGMLPMGDQEVKESEPASIVHRLDQVACFKFGIGHLRIPCNG